MPFPLATSSCAVRSTSVIFIDPPLRDLRRQRRVPPLHRREVSVVAQDIERRRIEKEVTSGGGRQPQPTCRKNSKNVSVGEERDKPFHGADSSNQTIDPRADLLRALQIGRASCRE